MNTHEEKQMFKPDLSKVLIAAALIATPFTLSADIVEIGNIELSGKYRVDTNDCPGCEVVDIRTEEDFANYLISAKEDTERSSNRPEKSTQQAPTSIRRDFGFNHRPFAHGHYDRTPYKNQVVYLNFDVEGEPTFPVCLVDADGNLDGVLGIFNDHVYTQEERDIIQDHIELDYADFNLTFTQEEPQSGDFSTVRFGDNDTATDCSERSNITVFPDGNLSVLFGRADTIDFGNRNKNDASFANASIWEFLAQLADGRFFEVFSNLNLAEDFNGDLSAALSFAVINQSANTGAHELGHTLGLRHQNSFGAPGDGLPSTGRRSPFDFVPVLDVPSNATETSLHTMASGASTGLPFDGGVNLDRFFSERSATRLAVNDALAQRFNRILLSEERTKYSNGHIYLPRLNVPNTILEGKNENALLTVNARVINGDISEVGERDSYTFYGRKGDFFNAELVPIQAREQNFEEGILGQLGLFQIHDDGSETLLAFNIRSFESPFDTELFDIILPENGFYRIDIVAPDAIFLSDANGNTLPPISLTGNGGGALQTGNYEVLAFTCNKRILDADIAKRIEEIRERIRTHTRSRW